MVSFGSLTGLNAPEDARRLEVVEARLRALLQSVLDDVLIDEDWYRRINQDVDGAIRAGTMSSARQHYVTAGYFEDRLPHPVTVDETWYVSQYPDVKEAIGSGYFTAQQHFDRSGYREGRLPYPGWTLQRSKEVHHPESERPDRSHS